MSSCRCPLTDAPDADPPLVRIPKLTAKPWLRISRLRRFFLDSSIVSRGNIDNLFDGMHDSVQELKEASFLVQSYASIPTSELMLMVVPHMPPWQQEMFLDVACKSWKRGFGQIKPEVLMSAIAPRIENLFTFIEKRTGICSLVAIMVDYAI